MNEHIQTQSFYIRVVSSRAKRYQAAMPFLRWRVWTLRLKLMTHSAA